MLWSHQLARCNPALAVTEHHCSSAHHSPANYTLLTRHNAPLLRSSARIPILSAHYHTRIITFADFSHGQTSFAIGKRTYAGAEGGQIARAKSPVRWLSTDLKDRDVDRRVDVG